MPGQSAQRQKRSPDNEKVNQKWWTLQFEWLLPSFAFDCAKLKLSAKAERRNKLSSLSELESVIMQVTILSVWVT